MREYVCLVAQIDTDFDVLLQKVCEGKVTQILESSEDENKEYR